MRSFVLNSRDDKVVSESKGISAQPLIFCVWPHREVVGFDGARVLRHRHRTSAAAAARRGGAVLRRQQLESLLGALSPTDADCPTDTEDDADDKPAAASGDGDASEQQSEREVRRFLDLTDRLAPPDGRLFYGGLTRRVLQRLARERADVLAAGEAMFCDAAPEFSTVEGIAARMEAWRATQPTSYHETYVPLNLVKVFAPLVRLEMLGWQPSDGCIEAFARQRWFSALENYGADPGEGKGAGSAPPPEHSDLDLIPALVEKVVLPRLQAWISMSWDPLSARSNTVALECVRELAEVFVTADKPAMHSKCASASCFSVAGAVSRPATASSVAETMFVIVTVARSRSTCGCAQPLVRHGGSTPYPHRFCQLDQEHGATESRGDVPLQLRRQVCRQRNGLARACRSGEFVGGAVR